MSTPCATMSTAESISEARMAMDCDFQYTYDLPSSSAVLATSETTCALRESASPAVVEKRDSRPMLPRPTLPVRLPPGWSTCSAARFLAELPERTLSFGTAPGSCCAESSDCCSSSSRGLSLGMLISNMLADLFAKDRGR
eukprot:scaffold99250_cov69-Phaeocystis_antarctica.AAC.6